MQWAKVTVTTFPVKMTPEEMLEEINERLEITGWCVKDRAEALSQVERPDGLIEIVRNS